MARRPAGRNLCQDTGQLQHPLRSHNWPSVYDIPAALPQRPRPTSADAVVSGFAMNYTIDSTLFADYWDSTLSQVYVLCVSTL